MNIFKGEIGKYTQELIDSIINTPDEWRHYMFNNIYKGNLVITSDGRIDVYELDIKENNNKRKTMDIMVRIRQVNTLTSITVSYYEKRALKRAVKRWHKIASLTTITEK